MGGHLAGWASNLLRRRGTVWENARKCLSPPTSIIKPRRLPLSVHMKPRWPTVTQSLRSRRSYEKIGDCEQSCKKLKLVIHRTPVSVNLTNSHNGLLRLQLAWLAQWIEYCVWSSQRSGFQSRSRLNCLRFFFNRLGCSFYCEDYDHFYNRLLFISF